MWEMMKRRKEEHQDAGGMGLSASEEDAVKAQRLADFNARVQHADERVDLSSNEEEDHVKKLHRAGNLSVPLGGGNRRQRPLCIPKGFKGWDARSATRP